MKYRARILSLPACALILVFSSANNLRADPGITSGQPSPQFDITSIDGQHIVSSELIERKAVYLKFWATWCVDCIEEMPHFVEAYQQYGDRIEFVAVNVAVNDTLERIGDTKTTHGIEMPIVFDDSGEMWSRFDVFGTPTHVVINVSGEIIHIGYEADEQLDRALYQAFQATPADEKPGQDSKRIAQAASTGTSVLVGDVAPEFTIDLLDGASFSLAETLEEVESVYIFFFTPWCESYVSDSFPEMSRECDSARKKVLELYQQHQNTSRFIGISSRYSVGPKGVEYYRDKYEIPFLLAYDASDELFRTYKVRHFPTHVIVDANGIIRLREKGDNNELAGAILLN